MASLCRPEALANLLADLAAQWQPSSLEVVLVLQEYADTVVAEVEARFGAVFRLRVLTVPRRLGLIHARNAGARMTSSEVVAFLDDDVRLRPDWSVSILRPFADPQVGGVCGYVTHGPGFPPRKMRVLRWLGLDPPTYTVNRFGVVRHPLTNFGRVDRPTMWLPGTGCAYRRVVLNAVGEFEPRFSYGFEDSDMGIRVRRAGWRLVLTPTATITHHPSAMHRMSRRQAAHHLEKVRVLAIRRALGEGGWRWRYWLAFLSIELGHVGSGILHRDWRLPIEAWRGAREGMATYGPPGSED